MPTNWETRKGKRLRKTNLSKANAHDGECDEDAPDHCSLIQIFRSVPALNKYQELEVERQGQNSMKDSLKY